MRWSSSEPPRDANAANDSATGCGAIGIAPVIAVLAAAILALGLLLIAGNPDRWEGIADPAEHPLSLASDPRHPETIFLGTEQGHILVSHDGGQRWAEHHQGLPHATPISALALLPNGAGVVAGTTGGVYISTNDAATWQPEGAGIPTDAIVDAIGTLSDGTLLAGTANNGIYVFQPGASEWVQPASGPPPRSDVYVFLVLPQSGHVLAGLVSGGVYASQDGGRTWAESDAGLGAPSGVNVFSLLSVPRPAGSSQAGSMSILAGTSRGVYLSRDGGTSWTASSAGVGSIRVISLARDPLVPTSVVAGTDNGVYQSEDAGASWDTVGCGLPPEQHVGLVGAIHPASGDRVLLASVDQLYRYPGQWFLSTQPWRALVAVALVLLILTLVSLVGWLLRAILAT